MARPRIVLFYIHKQLTEFRFREIESFVHHSRDGIQAVWDEFSKEFDKTTTGWPDDQVAEYVDYIYDDMAILRDESPQLLRHAQCMIIYGMFEHSVVNLCRTLHRDAKIAVAPPSKMYIHNVKSYLEPHLRSRPAPFAAEWQWVDEFRIIRNWMAHNGGKVQKDANPNGNCARANAFVRRNRKLIKFSRLGEIIVEDKLIDRAIEKVSGAIETLHDAAQQLYPRPRGG